MKFDIRAYFENLWGKRTFSQHLTIMSVCHLSTDMRTFVVTSGSVFLGMRNVSDT